MSINMICHQYEIDIISVSVPGTCHITKIKHEISCHRNCFRYKSSKSQSFGRSAMLGPRASGGLRVTWVGGAVAALKETILAAVIPSVEKWLEVDPVRRLSAVGTPKGLFWELPEPSMHLTFANSPPCTRPCNIHREVTSPAPSWDSPTKPRTPPGPTRPLPDPTALPRHSQPSPLTAQSLGVTSDTEVQCRGKLGMHSPTARTWHPNPRLVNLTWASANCLMIVLWAASSWKRRRNTQEKGRWFQCPIKRMMPSRPWEQMPWTPPFLT